MIINIGSTGRRRAILLAATALAAGLSSAARADTASTTTTATTTAAADAGAQGVGLDEVVVTAEKRETNLQKTPIAISVMNAQDLTNRHVQSLADLGDGAIPSLRIAPFFARNSALTIAVRGVGVMADANQPARDQAVGVYVDGVYLGRAQGLGSALFDVAQIEVLKGPQGTLFGRNTEGGAVSIVTRRPTGQFAMDATAGYQNYNGYLAETHIDLPSFHDISLKFDGLLSRRDGTVRNPQSLGQPDFNAYDKRGFQAQALWKPTDTFSADYAFDVSHDATTPYYVQLLKAGVIPLAPAIKLQPERASTANVGVPLNFSTGETWGHRLNLNWQASPSLTVKAIGSYRSLSQSQFDNGEENLSAFAPNGAFSRYSLANFYQNQYSGEVQLIGKFPRLDVVGGAMYYHEWVRDSARTPNSLQWNATGTASTFIPLNLDTVSLDRASHVTTQNLGLYGQGTWTPPVLNDIAHLTLGGRFSRDTRNGDLDTVNGALPSYVNASGTTITGIIPLNKTWDRFDPLVNLAIDATPDVNLYGRWSTGYKAGGANSRSLTYRAFDPESVSMFELGAKTQFWDRRVRLNADIFSGDIKDAQVDFSVVILGNNRGTLETTNAATGRTRGVEADIAVNPMQGLTFSAAYTYTDVSLSKAFNPFTNGFSVVYPLYTPKQAGSVSADYQHPALGALFEAHADVNMSGGQYTSSTDPTLSDPSTIVNARVALSDIVLSGSSARMQLSLWSRNLLDEQHAFLKNTSVLGVYGIFNEPRTFGVEANVKF